MIKFILDSGAHSLYNKFVRAAKTRTYNFYDSKEFWNFADKYAEFLLKYKDKIDTYVNLDVIFNPEKTLEVQEYFEKKYNLRPLPVIHFGEDHKYMKIYIDKGYDYIGIGGLGQEVTRETYTAWADPLFTNHICDENGYPKIKTHGFAMTSPVLLLRYPWYTVDSTTFVKNAAYGLIFVPQFRDGQWRYDLLPLRIFVTKRSQHHKTNYIYLGDMQRELLRDYVTSAGFKIGVSTFEGDEEVIQEKGVINDQGERAKLNARYYLELQKHLKYPRKFYGRKGLLL